MTWSFSQDACMYHRDDDTEIFIRKYFGAKERFTLWVGGAGFDPRSTNIPKLLNAAGAKVKGVMIREERPRPPAALKQKADEHEVTLKSLFDSSERLEVQIFSNDETNVIAGREAAEGLKKVDLTNITDIIVDMSALSVGVSFPLTKLFYEAGRSKCFPSVHIMATASTPTDEAVITSELWDRFQTIHGFAADVELEETQGKDKLWLPHLAYGKGPALKIIYDGIQPNETCPILPFPAASPRAVERLIDEYSTEIRGAWAVDHRDFLYAAENDPLDLYRTILRIDTLRSQTYKATGGAVTVLSPVGSKVMAIGALMAALERPLPVIYVETQRYMLNAPSIEPGGVIHIWLSGSAYH
ncbi:hypothetical protein GGR59_002464 [Xanthomonas arboricola]|uniref:hypothetical protein n=1 Tax=Xanthomonas arboricola TaxID=56448 RepID=UPI001619D920|nr:hypothetical protein [Xanthomonas arboricola]MBB4606219.1 hypothetical protein [Xanthomonas arboricola]